MSLKTTSVGQLKLPKTGAGTDSSNWCKGRAPFLGNSKRQASIVIVRADSMAKSLSTPSHAASPPMQLRSLTSSPSISSSQLKNMIFEMVSSGSSSDKCFGVGHDILGIDIGSYSIKAAPVDTRTGRLLAAKFHTPTPREATPEACADAISLIISTLEWQGAVGIALPCVVRGGTTLTAAHMHESWVNADVEAVFSKKLGLPVTFSNNADAAGYAEMGFGAGLGGRGTVFMVTFGRGIGTSMFVDGLLVPNLEFGHAQLKGVEAEALAAGALVKGEGLTWQEWADRVTNYLGYVERLFWPSLFIVGGGVSEVHEKWLPLVNLPGGTPVVPAALRNEAGVVGAAMAALARAAYDIKKKPSFVEHYINA